ncbi:hypothetical protein FA15DRAFT_686237 [Coprinopsis marcescibilis]|uniref:Uncharacterized protein n=1 Tax=Coprinopsis marcescibilis TaxID=230819 RepID=A0A5C3L1E5_COPMA|nr:hypothetical protein FA15DRAFT_686237 [Coprinopsis marcescibilis]
MGASARRTCIVIIQLAALSWATQVALQRTAGSNDHCHIPSSEDVDLCRWRFDIPLSSSNTTSNFIFDGVSSLLQEWGNTHYRSGHNIVPATMPTGTLLYHGTYRNVTPTTPEWVALDPELSYMFCRAVEEGKGCYHLTLSTTRPLNLLYFDGNSAAKLHGCMDAQDLIVWGDVDPDRLFKEDERINRLCEWGKQYKLDGFLRMQANFEIMLCDFRSGVEQVSFLNLINQGPALPPGAPPPKMPRLKQYPMWMFHYLESGHRYKHFPGETRVKLDLSKLVSFYDSDLFPSLSTPRIEYERWQHRVNALSKPDREQLLERLDEVLKAESGGSGVDWTSLYRVVIHRYADRLELLQYMLHGSHINTTSTTNRDTPRAEKIAKDVHEYAASLLTAYVLNDVRPRHDTKHPFSWASPVFEHCATTHTKFILHSLHLTSSERLLLKAVNDVLHEICRVVVGIWAEGMEIGLQSQDKASFEEVVAKWKGEMDVLVKWLDWSVWVKCKPECGYEETCYLPTFPFFRCPDGTWPTSLSSQPGVSGFEAAYEDGEPCKNTSSNGAVVPEYEWIRPQPRCIRRLRPLETLGW